MLLGRLFTGMLFLALFSGAITGRMAEVSAAALSGAGDAVSLVLQIGGMLVLWSGIMELMRRSRLTDAVSRALQPVLRLFLPLSSKNPEIRGALAANMSANLLGLGNAATPPGLFAIQRMKKGENGAATDEICRLVVLNSCSIQLFPMTAAALRAANGAANPFDILPEIWFASAISVAAGLGSAVIFAKVWKE